MKFWIIFLSCVITFVKAQKLELQPLLNSKISIRAIDLDGNKVWFVGTDSQLGFVNMNEAADHKIISLSSNQLQFRTLAQDDQYLYTISIGSPAYFYKVDKKTLEYEIFYTDEDKNAFYDALVLDQKDFYTFSDPEETLKLKWLKFNLEKSGDLLNYLSKKTQLTKGEAAFAASNSNIAVSNEYVWLATGGVESKIYRWNKRKSNLEIFPTPIIQGKTTQGIYTIDFYQKFGIAAGGDYTQPQENTNNIATTKNAGKTWTVRASGKNAGYTTCVKIRPGTKGKEIIAVGDHHISYSSDYGKTWEKISDEKDFYTCFWKDEKTLVFAGKNKIAKGIFLPKKNK